MHKEFFAIGTTWQIDLPHPHANYTVEVLDTVARRIEEFEKTYSRFRDDSLVHEISQKAGVYVLPADAIPMFDMYRKLYELSLGSITPLIGQVLHDTGYDASYTLMPKHTIRPVPAWNDVLKYTPTIRTLTVYQPVQLDLGAIGKGYLVDIVRNMFEERGITSYTIDAGRDIYHKGAVVDVALENPFDTTQAIGIAHITEGSICGSAGNRRAWSAYTHIIDPKTNTSPNHIAAVWVAANTAMLADSLTTALFFTSIEVLQKNFSFEYVIVYEDGSAAISQNFPGTLF